jgi:hypothetical protein
MKELWMAFIEPYQATAELVKQVGTRISSFYFFFFLLKMIFMLVGRRRYSARPSGFEACWCLLQVLHQRLDSWSRARSHTYLKGAIDRVWYYSLPEIAEECVLV